MKKQQAARNGFSLRSQASLGREAELRQQVENVEKQIAYANQNLGEQETRRDIYRQTIANGGATDGYTVIYFDRCLREIESLSARIESLGELKKNLEANIEAERMIPSDRAGIQAGLADVARKRLELDRRLEEQLDGLRDTLSKRDALTREMKGLAHGLELSADFDEERFSALLEALTPVLPESERWIAKFMGSEGKGLVRAFARVRLEIPEQLHQVGIFEPGDAVLLTEEQFSALSEAKFTLAPGETTFVEQMPKHFRPRQVVGREQYEQDTAAAKAAGLSLADFWRSQDREDFKALQEQWGIESRRVQWDRRVEYQARAWGQSEDKARREVERQYGPRPA